MSLGRSLISYEAFSLPTLDNTSVMSRDVDARSMIEALGSRHLKSTITKRPFNSNCTARRHSNTHQMLGFLVKPWSNRNTITETSSRYPPFLSQIA